MNNCQRSHKFVKKLRINWLRTFQINQNYNLNNKSILKTFKLIGTSPNQMDNETLTQDVIAGASEPKRLFGMPTQNLLAIIMVFFLFMVSSGIYLFFKILEERGVKYDTTASVGEPDTWFKRLTWMG